MRWQLKQILLLSGFGILCTVFVLFIPFGGQKEVPQDIEELQVSSGEVAEIAHEQQEIRIQQPLRLLVPQLLYGSWLANLLSTFSGEQKSDLFLDFYREEMSDEVLFSGNYDLLLLPYDRIADQQFLPIRFQEDIREYFSPLLGDLLKKRSDFLPFSFDPAVFFTMSKSLLSFDLAILSDWASSWQPKHNLSFFSLWFVGTSPAFSQNLLLAWFLDKLVGVNDVGAFQLWLDTQKGGENLEKLSKLMVKKWGICASSPLLCMVLNGFLEYYEGFASEYSLAQQESSPQKQLAQLKMHPYPYQGFGYPVRLYGFVVPDRAELSPLVWTFLASYMQKGVNPNTQLWETTFPAFTDHLSRACYEKTLCAYFDPLAPLALSPERVTGFMKDRLLKTVLEKKYKPDLYLEKALLYLE